MTGVDTAVLASLAATLLALAAAFQIGLAVGAPWGAGAYGGRAASESGTLPRSYRITSAGAAVVLLAACWVVLAAASVIDRGRVSTGVLTVALWSLVVLFTANTIGNARGRHPLERWGAGTVTALLAVLCALIAIG